MGCCNFMGFAMPLMRKKVTSLTYRGDKERDQYIISKKFSEVCKKISEVFFMSPLLFPFKILRFFVFVLLGALVFSMISPSERDTINPPQSVERSY